MGSVLALLVTVSGMYSHEAIEGQWRYCYYTSPYGTHVYMLNQRFSCPMDKEFEVDDDVDGS